MSESTTTTPAPVVSLDEVQDGSHFADGFDAAAFVAAAGGFVKSASAKFTSWTNAVQALAFLRGIVATVTLTEGGFPVWNLSDLPEAGKVLLASLIEAAGLDEAAGKELLTASVRVQWNRIREQWIAAYVLSQYEGASVATTVESTTQAENNHRAALRLLPDELLAFVPEILGDGPFVPSKFSDKFKRGMAEQYRHAKLDLPEKYGGTPKDGNAKGTKDKQNAPLATINDATSTVAEKIGAEGGVSYVETSLSLLRLTSAVCVGYVAAAEVQDRPKVDEYLGRCQRMIAATLDPKRTDAEAVTSLAFDPKNDK